MVPLVSQSQRSRDANYLLNRYVVDGLVYYEGINQDSALADVKKFYEEFDYHKLDSLSRMAHLINAYNFFVIHEICQSYPVASPMDISGFFDTKKHTIGGEEMTLDHLENKVLRKDYFDPRLHFVLVCGAMGCPRLASEAYTNENLEKMLQQRTDLALNSDWFVYQNDKKKTVFLSEIFKWYKEDFGGTNALTVQYINGFRENPFDENFTVKTYPYDWALNIGSQINDIRDVSVGVKGDTIKDTVVFTVPVTPPPAISEEEPVHETFNLQTFNAGSLLAKGQMDFTLFNSMYTETRQNWLGTRFSGYRSTFASSLLQWTIGVDPRKRFNVGLDLTLRANGRTDADSSFSAINRAFEFSNTDSTRFGLTSVGIRAKWQPFKEVDDFTIQSTLSVPVIEHPEGYYGTEEDPLSWADWNRITWWNQLFYTKSFGNFQLFTEFDLLFRFKTDSAQIGMLDTPVSLFLSYFPTPKITIYAMTQHLHRFTNNIEPYHNGPNPTDWVIPASYTASGFGFKYQFKRNLNLELLYTNFWRSRNNGLGSTFNLGVKYITGG